MFLIQCVIKLTSELGKHRDLQRMTVPYAKLLGVTRDLVKQDDTIMS